MPVCLSSSHPFNSPLPPWEIWDIMFNYRSLSICLKLVSEFKNKNKVFLKRTPSQQFRLSPFYSLSVSAAQLVARRFSCRISLPRHRTWPANKAECFDPNNFPLPEVVWKIFTLYLALSVSKFCVEQLVLSGVFVTHVAKKTDYDFCLRA